MGVWDRPRPVPNLPQVQRLTSIVARYIYIYIYTINLYLFAYLYGCVAASAALSAPTYPSIKEAAFGARPTVVDSFTDGCVGAGEAADAAKHA